MCVLICFGDDLVEQPKKQAVVRFCTNTFCLLKYFSILEHKNKDYNRHTFSVYYEIYRSRNGTERSKFRLIIRNDCWNSFRFYDSDLERNFAPILPERVKACI